MSHFTRIQTKLQNMATVQRALEDLGYVVEEGGKVRGHGNQRTATDLVVTMDGRFDVGFGQQSNGEVTMVADFWSLKVDRKAFLEQITQRYAYFTVLEQAEAQGFHVTTQENQQDGSIRLVMQRW